MRQSVTPLILEVLELYRFDHTSFSAEELCSLLGDVKPPSVRRALARLAAKGEVDVAERHNAFKPWIIEFTYRHKESA